jgi:hypothetical protein
MPVPLVIISIFEYVPPDAKVKFAPMFNDVPAGVHVLPVKLRLLIQLPEEIVGTDAPELIAKFKAVDVDPIVDPILNDLVTDIPETNPPGPVQEKFVKSGIFTTVCAAVV